MLSTNVFESIGERYNSPDKTYFEHNGLNWKMSMKRYENMCVLCAFTPFELKDNRKNSIDKMLNAMNETQSIGTYRIVENPENTGIEMRTSLLIEENEQPTINSLTNVIEQIEAEFNSTLLLIMEGGF